MRYATLRPFTLLLAALATAGVPAADEDFCPGFGPDGLSPGICWDPVQANLPDLPGFFLEGLGICFDDCNPLTEDVVVQVSPPNQTHCGQYVAEITITDPAGLLLLRGLAQLDYTRTWQERSPLGFDYQVWRFAWKVDLLGDWLFTPICPVPTCLGPVLNGYDDAFFYGHVDYALNCESFEWQHAMSLFHNCDVFIHRADISDHPGSFHPTETYAVVAPGASFVPGPTGHPGGPLLGEAVRNVNHPLVAGLCVVEEPIAQGELVPLFEGCACPLAFVPPLNTASLFSGFGSCPIRSAFTALNLFPTAPWFALHSTALGRWTDLFTYPGEEGLLVDEGLFAYFDGCAPTPVGQGQNNVDIFYGAETTEGYEPIPEPPFELSPFFIDLASNFSFPLPGMASPPFVGSVKPTDHLIYVNTF